MVAEEARPARGPPPPRRRPLPAAAGADRLGVLSGPRPGSGQGHVALVQGDRLLDVLEVGASPRSSTSPLGAVAADGLGRVRGHQHARALQPALEGGERLRLKAVSPTAVISSTRYQSKATPIDMPKASRAFMPEE